MRELALFGSVVREDFRDDSDVDILVEFEPGAPVGMYDFIGLQEDLADVLQRDVDLVSKKGLHPFNRDEVLADAQPIWPKAAAFTLAPARRIQRERMQLVVMLEAIDGMGEIVADHDREAALACEMVCLAITYELIRIGIIAERLPQYVKSRYPDPDWDRWQERGERLRTRYDGVDRERVWEIAIQYIPVLRRQIIDITRSEAALKSNHDTA